MTVHADLLDRISAFLARHGMAAARLGKLAVNDPNIVREVKAGRELRQRTIGRLDKFMREHDQNASAVANPSASEKAA